MNIGLIFTTILTSAADSLNPVAITQQFFLQGMVKRRHHIWYFIIATYITNFIFGILAYYGLLAVLSNFWDKFYTVAGKGIYAGELLFGLVLLAFAVRGLVRLTKKRTQIRDEELSETVMQKSVKSVRPASLFVLGVTATIMELTSALPYYAFITVLVNYQLPFLEVFLIQFIYNLIYASPLIILYILYCKKQELFDRIYVYIKKIMEKLSAYVIPLLLLTIAAFLLWNSMDPLF